ncbi:MAG: F0F1 ATP synthase subunit A [Clostridia bacterium]|nr:F0F1 ATP synthase subunit A [Clostridia bacterium]
MTKTLRFKIVDALYLLGVILPFLAAIVLKVITYPASEGINVTGALVFFTLPLPFGGLPVTETQVNSVAVLLAVFFLCLYITHGLDPKGGTKRQLVAELIVTKTRELVLGNMGERFAGFVPFVAAIMALSAFSSLSSLIGLHPPTSDINVTAGWAIFVFILITYYKLKGGVGNYLKGYTEPIPLFTPLNVIGELATPVSMAFRHYGNVLSGVAIAALISAALQGLSRMLLGWLPGFLGEIPFLQIGLPAVLSLYFDLFSSILQAFIFAMLTMLYIANGFPEEQYLARLEKKRAKREAKANK